ncbi:MAG: hypothetical protein ACM3PY_09885 [Omnitrophica WOR_2 bacterium]
MKQKKFSHMPLFNQLAGLSLLVALILAACSPQQPIVQTVVVVVTATTTANDSSLLTGSTATPVTVNSSPTQTPENNPIQEATATNAPPPRPSPTPLVLVSVPVEGDKGRIRARILYPTYNPAATTDLVFQVKAHNPQAGNYDGAGIDSIDFVISKDGQQVYSRTEKNAAYCAFGGGEPDCNIFNFASNNYQWPQTGIALQSGTYTLDITIHSANGDSWGGQITFNIQLPG